jgi:hypothetical protein
MHTGNSRGDFPKDNVGTRQWNARRDVRIVQGIPPITIVALDNTFNINKGVPTPVPFDRAAFDPYSGWDVSQPTRIYVLGPGLGLVIMQGTWPTNADTRSSIRLNGTTELGAQTSKFDGTHQNFAIIWNFAEGDYVECLALFGGGGAPLITTLPGSSNWSFQLAYAFSQIGCRAKSTVNQVTATGVTTILNLEAEDFDLGSFHDNAVNNSRLTFPQNGTYLILGHVAYAINNTGYRRALIRVNGATFIANPIEQSVDQGIMGHEPIVSTQWRATAGQYCELAAAQNTGGNLDVTSCHLMALLLQ